jgi:hypothetical protein
MSESRGQSNLESAYWKSEGVGCDRRELSIVDDTFERK